MANVCCSIEMEPKTLNQGQLNHAREVAADVVQTMESKEASIIFVKGMETIGAREEKEKITIDKRDQIIDKIVECNPNEKTQDQINIEIPCQCSLMNNNVIVDSPDQIHLKEPLSAPF